MHSFELLMVLSVKDAFFLGCGAVRFGIKASTETSVQLYKSTRRLAS